MEDLRVLMEARSEVERVRKSRDAWKLATFAVAFVALLIVASLRSDINAAESNEACAAIIAEHERAVSDAAGREDRRN